MIIMENYINKEYYLPLLKKFCEIALPLYECGYPQGPFIPYTMPNYKDAPIRIMYVGQDSSEWTRYNILEEAYKTNNLDEYLEANKSNVSIKNMFNWNNKSGAFWPFVEKLHLLIRTGKFFSDITSINNDQKTILKEVGYGNLYSIEIPGTIRKRIDSYEDIEVIKLITDKNKYQRIRDAAKPFETVKSMIEAYNPDYIFVLSWTDKDDFFEGTDFQRLEYGYEEDYRAIFTSKVYHTKIIWSSHPNRFSFLKTDVEEMCYFLAETYRQLDVSE